MRKIIIQSGAVVFKLSVGAGAQQFANIGEVNLKWVPSKE
jgi:hypothetical protein